MLECLLVVALTVEGDVVSRTLAMVNDVPEASHAMVMAFEAGRAGAENAALRSDDRANGRLYGYDCGAGWVDHGVAEADVFAKPKPWKVAKAAGTARF